MSCYRSICSGRLPKQQQQQRIPFSNQHQLSLTTWVGLPVGGFLHQFETRLNSSWRTALFIKWYAVLINVVEACFALHEMTERKRTGTGGNISSAGGGRFRCISRNMHFVTEMVMLQSNGMAIYGLLKPNTLLLVPYIVLHVITLVLELNYFITRTALGWTWDRPPTSGTSAHSMPSSWKPKRGTTSLSMLVLSHLIC
ncbi:uncharacterized protein LOC134224289 [Armigeres subalbatus]|uniref:uncharacterized protein LOC134224289 n=1 Tax=Armigeres subalbatus TaxID=124917 RepID=UPI002ED5BCF1